MSDEKKILIIAGPNGAGKTTFAKSFLPQEAACRNFINADLIAAGLSPFAPESVAIPAAHLMLKLYQPLVGAWVEIDNASLPFVIKDWSEPR